MSPVAAVPEERPAGLPAVTSRTDALRYLDAVFGTGTTGLAHLNVWSGQYADAGKYQHSDRVPVTYDWPVDRDRMAIEAVQAAVDGADVYVTPYLLAGPKRTKGTAVDRRLVHADIDGELDLAKVRALGGFAVGSGTPGHGHAYLALAEAVTVDMHTTLCRAFGNYLGDADAKISDNDLLRLPGTLNHKPTVFDDADPAPVTWLIEPTGHAWTVADLTAALATAGALIGAPLTLGQPVDPAVWPRTVRAALGEVTGDRSADTMRVVGACLDAGLTLEETRAVVASRQDLAFRLAERRDDDDVQRCFQRAVDARQIRVRRERELIELAHTAQTPTADRTDERPEARLPAAPLVVGHARPLLEMPTLAELCAEVDARGARKWLVRGVWPSGAYGVHAAEPKAGKTWSALDLAVSVASGTPWLGSLPVDDPGPVLVFAGEGGDGNVVRRIRAIAASRQVKPEELPMRVCTRAPKLNDDAAMAVLGDHLRATRPRLVVLDPLYLFARGAKLGDLYAMGELLEVPQLLCAEIGASLVVVHHYNRQRDQTGANRITGAGPAEWGRVLLTAEVVSRRTDTTTRATTVISKLDVLGGEVPDTTYRVTRTVSAADPDDLDSPMTYAVSVAAGGQTEGNAGPGDATDGLPPAAVKILQAVRALDRPVTQDQIVDEVKERHGHGLTRPTVSRQLNELQRRGLVDHHEDDSLPGFPTNYWFPAESEPPV